MDSRNDYQLQALTETWTSPKGFRGWFTVVNQTYIGRRYLVTAMIFFIMAGILGLLMRSQLAVANNNLVQPELYNQLFSMHGIAMMFLFAIPIVEGFGVYVVPLMIGTRDLSFPRLSAFSYYVFLIGGIVLWVSLLLGQAPTAGWFNYVPLALKEFSEKHGIDVYTTVITFIEISALAAAVELIVTILKQKCPGMSLGRMPPFVWSILVMAFMIVFAMPTIVVGSILLCLDRVAQTQFFVVEKGGDPLLWQHLFWWFGHPEVYIVFLPAAGIISTVIPVFSRRPLFARTAVIVSMVATGVISFGLWVHHMFTTGLPLHTDSFFAAASGLIGLPTGIQIFAWIATLWRSRPTYTTSFLFALGFLFIFVIGGLTGVMLAMVPFNTQAHDSYFVVAHFHYVLIGGGVFPFLAGLYYWFPSLTGRLLNETLGKVQFWMAFVGFHVAFFPMHLLGMMGMPRRVYTYDLGTGWELANLISTFGGFVFGLSFLVFIFNFFRTLNKGEKAGPNPWQAGTLEWSTGCPPPPYNFESIPKVQSAEPLWSEKPPQAAVSGMDVRRREVVTTSVVDGDLQAIIRIPHPTPWPFILALSCGIGFVGVIFSLWWFVVAFFLATGALTGWFWPKLINWRNDK